MNIYSKTILLATFSVSVISNNVFAATAPFPSKEFKKPIELNTGNNNSIIQGKQGKILDSLSIDQVNDGIFSLIFEAMTQVKKLYRDNSSKKNPQTMESIDKLDFQMQQAMDFVLDQRSHKRSFMSSYLSRPHTFDLSRKNLEEDLPAFIDLLKKECNRAATEHPQSLINLKLFANDLLNKFFEDALEEIKEKQKERLWFLNMTLKLFNEILVGGGDPKDFIPQIKEIADQYTYKNPSFKRSVDQFKSLVEQAASKDTIELAYLIWDVEEFIATNIEVRLNLLELKLKNIQNFIKWYDSELSPEAYKIPSDSLKEPQTQRRSHRRNQDVMMGKEVLDETGNRIPMSEFKKKMKRYSLSPTQQSLQQSQSEVPPPRRVSEPPVVKTVFDDFVDKGEQIIP